MIFGVGTDIVSKKRVANLLSEYGDKFVCRILTIPEISVFEGKKDDAQIDYLTRRFAAKEAISKSVGVGIGEKLSFKDIEILNEKSGKPYANVKGYENLRFSISISDEKDGGYAVAFAIAEK